MSSPIAIAMPIRPQPGVDPATMPGAAAPARPAPVDVTPAAAPAPKPLADAAAVAEALRRIAPARTDLQFRVEPGAGKVVVSVIDAESGEVVRQMPSEEALRIARNLAEIGTGIFDGRA